MAGKRGRRGAKVRRGEGQGQGEAAQGTYQDACNYSQNIITQQKPKDQDFVFNPSICRYSTRRAKAILAQCATLPSLLRSPIRHITSTPRHSSSLNPAIGIQHETDDEPLTGNIDPQMQDAASQQPKDGLTTNKVDKSAGGTHCCGPICNHWLDHDNLTTKLVSQCQGPQQVEEMDPVPPFLQDALDNDRLSRENHKVPHGKDRPEKSTINDVPRDSQCLSRCHSLNLTEFAQKLHDDLDDDPEEVESAFDPAFDCVHGHRVKIEIAPLVTAIFKKHGDITAESAVKSSNILAFFLDRLCDIYDRLKRTTFFDVTLIELSDMLDEVCVFEREKLNVGWLRERLEYISKTKSSFQEYIRVKGDEAKYDVSIGRLEKELEEHHAELSHLKQRISLVQQNISALEEKLVAEKGNAARSKKVALDVKTRVNTLRKQKVGGWPSISHCLVPYKAKYVSVNAISK